MTKRMRLMADYSAYPLWSLDPESLGPINPGTLPLQPETRLQLQAWSQKYDAQLNLDDPVNSPFLEGQELQEFEAEGIRLWLKLREELALEYEVGYFSQVLQKHLRHPDELSPGR